LGKSKITSLLNKLKQDRFPQLTGYLGNHQAVIVVLDNIPGRTYRTTRWLRSYFADISFSHRYAKGEYCRGAQEISGNRMVTG
jgi:transposase